MILLHIVFIFSILLNYLYRSNFQKIKYYIYERVNNIFLDHKENPQYTKSTGQLIQAAGRIHLLYVLRIHIVIPLNEKTNSFVRIKIDVRLISTLYYGLYFYFISCILNVRDVVKYLFAISQLYDLQCNTYNYFILF